MCVWCMYDMCWCVWCIFVYDVCLCIECVFVYMTYVCVNDVCLSVWVCGAIYVWQKTSGVGPCLPLSFSWSLKQTTWPLSFQGFSCLHSCTTWVTGGCFTWILGIPVSGDSNSNAHRCIVSILRTEPAPKSSGCFNIDFHDPCPNYQEKEMPERWILTTHGLQGAVPVLVLMSQCGKRQTAFC